MTATVGNFPGFCLGERLVRGCCFCSDAVKGMEVYLKCFFYLETALGTSHPTEPSFLPFKLGMKVGGGAGFVYFLAPSE